MFQTSVQKQRLVVQKKLESIKCVKHVYYQPPSSERLEYPCIIYELSNYESFNANNKSYLYWPRYTVTAISSDPESMIPEIIRKFSDGFYTTFSRFFTVDNLNHWVFDMVVTKSIDEENFEFV